MCQLGSLWTTVGYGWKPTRVTGETQGLGTGHRHKLHREQRSGCLKLGPVTCYILLFLLKILLNLLLLLLFWGFPLHILFFKECLCSFLSSLSRAELAPGKASPTGPPGKWLLVKCFPLSLFLMTFIWRMTALHYRVGFVKQNQESMSPSLESPQPPPHPTSLDPVTSLCVFSQTIS